MAKRATTSTCLHYRFAALSSAYQAQRAAETGDDKKIRQHLLGGVDAFRNDTPLAYVRIDPRLAWFRRVRIFQTMEQWAAQLYYDNDVVSHLEAIAGVSAGLISGRTYSPIRGARESFGVLRAVMEDKHSRFYYRVRAAAAASLVKWQALYAPPRDDPTLVFVIDAPGEQPAEEKKAKGESEGASQRKCGGGRAVR